ncbi:MAG: hypothetical protein IRY91_02130 [Gemmatimonadaceae bacterium]|nr:hypothetical protein [Gemmatimonadaceae bacterium]
MLTRERLLALADALRATHVLTVYLPGRADDPAQRSAWRTALETELKRLQESLTDAPRSERTAFDQAAAAVTAEMAPVTGTIRSPGWMVLATADGVRYSDALPMPIPLCVRWGVGILLAPAFRALEETRPAIVAVVDSRSARLYRHTNGALEALETIRAEPHVEPALHMGRPARPGYHSGTRGRTRAEARERDHRAGRARMMRTLSERMTALAGPGAWLLVGGTPTAVTEAVSALPDTVAHRTLALPTLLPRSRASTIAARAAEGAAVLREREDVAAVRGVLEHASANGRATAGLHRTRAALAAGAVSQLLVTARFLEERADDAEPLVRAAVAERAAIEVVSGEGGALLDAEAGGVAARLRFAPPDVSAAGEPREARGERDTGPPAAQ